MAWTRPERAPRTPEMKRLWVGPAVRQRFNEAEARAPRMPLAYRPLRIKAICPYFRAISYGAQQRAGDPRGKISRCQEPQ